MATFGPSQPESRSLDENQHLDSDIIERNAPGRVHNASLPIHTLPTELLLNILELHMQHYSKRQNKSWYSRIAELSKVCTHWWEIVKQSPTLWTLMRPYESKEAIDRALERSSNHQLDVSVDERTITHWGDLKTFVGYLSPHVGRWRSLDILSLDRTLESMMDVLIHPMPSLQVARLSHSMTAWTTPVDLFGGKAPKLTDLTLDGIPCRWGGGAIHGLSALDLSWVSFPSAATILDIISNSPQLQKLVIRTCTVDSGDITSLPTITAARLALLHLDLGSPQLVEIITDHIDTGKRCSFGTALLWSGGLDDVVLTVAKWVRKEEIKALPPSEGVTLDVSTKAVRAEFYPSDKLPSFSVLVYVMQPGQETVQILACINDLLSPFKGSTTACLRLGHFHGQRTSWWRPLIDELSRSPRITSLEMECDYDISFWRALFIQGTFTGNDSIFGEIRSFGVRTSWDSAGMPESIITMVKATDDNLKNTSKKGLERVGIRVTRLLSQTVGEAQSSMVKRLEDIVGVGNVFTSIDD